MAFYRPWWGVPCLGGSVMPVPSFLVAQSTVEGGGHADPTYAFSTLAWTSLLVKGNCFCWHFSAASARWCQQCVAWGAGMQGARLFVSPLKSLAWALSYSMDAWDKKRRCRVLISLRALWQACSSERLSCSGTGGELILFRPAPCL